MSKYSKYVLVVDNVTSATTSREIEKEFDFCGPIRDVIRDAKARCALVEFERYTLLPLDRLLFLGILL